MLFDSVFNNAGDSVTLFLGPFTPGDLLESVSITGRPVNLANCWYSLELVNSVNVDSGSGRRLHSTVNLPMHFGAYTPLPIFLNRVLEPDERFLLITFHSQNDDATFAASVNYRRK